MHLVVALVAFDHGRHPAAPFCPHDIPDLRYICYFCSYSAYTPVPGLVNTIPEPLITLNGPWSNRCMLKLAEKLPPMGLPASLTIACSLSIDFYYKALLKNAKDLEEGNQRAISR